MKNLLITGFEPFGGEKINPSWEAVRLLPDTLGNWRIHKLQLPVLFGKAADAAWEAAQLINPEAILCVGQAGGRTGVTPEQVAINLRNGTDNDGNSYLDAPVIDGGPPAYFSTLKVRDVVHAVQDAGIAASLSYSAGTFVCNDTLYTLLHRCAQTNVTVGFVHVPYLPEQAPKDCPSMSLDDIVKALEAAILSSS